MDMNKLCLVLLFAVLVGIVSGESNGGAKSLFDSVRDKVLGVLGNVSVGVFGSNFDV